ncbi:hypothetical protein AXK11_06295 [Cephaloticoccus primus]|uniref:Uncharacterized protein n=1 Tax=Cephaloticoccus primus TaxID=1548207 RepID=A0A139SLR3_9BACT|nr:efflux RND transporter periplasmic adaptor subunit [Cephaloticoccus primus]KXU35487.1 hypothetical protein AXK11_06295 [Cephaloticoccus primus]
MFKRSALFLLGAFALIGAIVFVKVTQVRAVMAQDFTPPPSAVVSTIAEEQDWEQTLQTIGTLSAVQGIMVETELEGKVVEIAFESGARVNAGDLLLRQDTSTERAQLADAEASAALARINYERAAGLRKQEANSRAEYDTARAALDSAEAQVAAIKAMIEKKTLRAPFAGRLGIRAVNFGQFVRGGQAVVPLFSLDPIYVDFSLPQQRLTALEVGQEVKISVDAFEGERFEGRLTAINPQVDSATRNVQVQATLANPDGRLRPGMFAKAQVVMPKVARYVTLPTTAISFNSYGDAVFIVEPREDGAEGLVVRQQFVKVGPRRGSQVAILSGVKPGEQVVVGGLTKLQNRSPVVINNTVQPSSNPEPALPDS